MKLNPNCPTCRARASGILKAKRAGKCGRYPPITKATVREFLALRAKGMHTEDAAKALGVSRQGAQKAAKKYGLSA